MRVSTLALAGSALIALASPALAGPAEDFRKLQDDFWTAYLKAAPTFASLNGVDTYAGELERIDRPEMERRVAEARTLLARLDAIPASALSPAEQTNHALLRDQLQTYIDGALFGSNFIPYTSGGTYDQNLAQYLGFLPLKTEADYESFLQRLGKVGDRLRTANAMSLSSARAGYARPCSTLGPLDKITASPPDADPAKSAFYEQFAKPRPTAISAAKWSAMQARARTLITQDINPAITAFNAAYASDLKPACLKSDGMAALPDGKANYAYLVRYHTTTDRSPDDIHQLGLSEVARIRAEMDALAKKSGFASREAMIADMRSNPKYFARTPEELMQYTARMTKTIDGKMPTLFGKLPRLAYTIKEIPAATAEGATTAYYFQGSPEAGIAGTYFVNTSKLDQRPLWEIPALTVHEAVPGHHQQISLQQELDMPVWRKNAAYFTAFVEGWGLYSERLGIEMGLYDTPQKDMGRLGYEMWRAARLVVDTGIHAKGWDKARAVAFMKDNTTLTDANIDAEVNRYISTPGQALAYKLGELKIRELRTLAERELGPKFYLRRFHDAVLEQGPLPLTMLETQVRAWIAREKAKA
ncbi:DUF885 domain-containing protein [Sphingomonas sabuli]|uniref:DUF885 domain-containing protein n=1 Tax=Sphingomonas sabuli TaxID=2764186 RepID=A0A7G9L1E5_9SPHN|nr:DUF885 domain-containing protein [Sphingomonas sabuli]QNM82444.1 DUF885 domain-containing protein [Sphingomonas sabuli]